MLMYRLDIASRPIVEDVRMHTRSYIEMYPKESVCESARNLSRGRRWPLAKGRRLILQSCYLAHSLQHVV